jgi:hypothetical protein
MGPVRTRLEQAGSQLPTETRLPLEYLDIPDLAGDSHAHHVSDQCGGS